MNPFGGDDDGRDMATQLTAHQRTVGAYPLPGYGPVVFVNRLLGGVGREGGKSSLTRFGANLCTYRPNPVPYPIRDCNHYDCDQKVFADDLPRWLAL